MQNEDRKYYIYLRSINERVPCTKEEFNDYYRGINAYRRTQQNRGNCVCPASKRLESHMDCWTSPFRRRFTLSNTISELPDESIDALYENLFDLPGEIIDTICFRELLARLCELMPQAIEIGRLRQQGLSDEVIAGIIGIGRKTFVFRLKRAAERLKSEYTEFF